MTDRAQDKPALTRFSRRVFARPSAAQPHPNRPDLEALDAAATPGTWGQFAPAYGPFKEEAREHCKQTGWSGDIDSSHQTSTVSPEGKPYRVGEFRHADDALFAETLVNEFRAGRLIPAPETNS